MTKNTTSGSLEELLEYSNEMVELHREDLWEWLDSENLFWGVENQGNYGPPLGAPATIPEA